MRLSDAVAAIRQQIVQIGVPGGAGGEVVVLGTGFFAGSGLHVVTAKHVVDAVRSAGQTLPLVGLPFPDITTAEVEIRAGFQHIWASIVDEDADNDLALLYIPPPSPAAASLGGRLVVNGVGFERTPTTAVSLDIREPREGSEISTSGFPLSQPSLVTTAGVLASVFSPDLDHAAADRFLGDFTVAGGNSGGPVYAVDTAAVIGVCVAGRLDAVIGAPQSQYLIGHTIIVPAQAVAQLLRTNGLDPNIYQPGARARARQRKPKR